MRFRFFGEVGGDEVLGDFFRRLGKRGAREWKGRSMVVMTVGERVQRINFKANGI
jgi:hypothetical protein